jgi:hypothetical protein
MPSMFLFDAPGSTSNHFIVALFWSFIALPLCWFLGAGLPWLFRSKKLGWLPFALPFVDLIAIVSLIIAIGRQCHGAGCP